MAKPEIINDIDSKAPLTHNHSVDNIIGTLPVNKGGTGTTSLSSLASNLSSYISSGCQIAVGSYIGNNSTTNTISIGFKPKAIFITNNDGIDFDDYSGCPTVFMWNDTIVNRKVYGSDGIVECSTTSTTFTMKSQLSDYSYNGSGFEYFWIAFG